MLVGATTGESRAVGDRQPGLRGQLSALGKCTEGALFQVFNVSRTRSGVTGRWRSHLPVRP